MTGLRALHAPAGPELANGQQRVPGHERGRQAAARAGTAKGWEMHVPGGAALPHQGDTAALSLCVHRRLRVSGRSRQRATTHSRSKKAPLAPLLLHPPEASTQHRAGHPMTRPPFCPCPLQRSSAAHSLSRGLCAVLSQLGQSPR